MKSSLESALRTAFSQRRIPVLLVIAVLVLLPLAVGTYIQHLLILALMYSILAMSYDLSAGYAGVFNLGLPSFFGIGAYTSALLSLRIGISPWLGLLLGGGAAAAIGILVSLPCLRLRGAYIVVVTIGFNEILRIVFSNFVEITRGELGLWGIPVFSPTSIFSGISKAPFYYLIMVLFLVAAFVLHKIVKSPIGLAFVTVRDDLDAAESLGVNSTKYKVLAFIISSFFTGVVGAFFAHYITVLTPSSVFSFDLMILIMAIVLLGGPATIFGPVITAFLLTFVFEGLRFFAGEYRVFIYGSAIVVAAIFMPKGILGAIKTAVNRLRASGSVSQSKTTES